MNCVGAVIVGLGRLAPLAAAQSLDYPETRKVDDVDIYHGTKVAEPYRWLEDDRSEETAQWVKAENQITFSYLDKIPYRPQVMKRLEQLFNYPRYSAPFRRGEYFFFFKNHGFPNHSVLFISKGVNGTPAMVFDSRALFSVLFYT